MSFRCCQNCLVDMICSEPCEKFQVNELHLDDLLSFHNCLRLLKSYKNKTFNLKNQLDIVSHNNVIYFYKYKKLHRSDNEPAVIYKNGSKSWYKNGKRHRDNGPAIIFEDGSESWYNHGHLHRDDGPAMIYADGSKSWYQHGNRHRDNEPAVIYADGSELWYQHGVRH